MSQSRKYLLALPLVAAAALVVGLWLGYGLARPKAQSPARQKLNDILDAIEQNYVDPISLDSLIEMAIPDLLANLDPHSAYIPASERMTANRDLESSFYGIGIQFQMMNDTLYVAEVISGAAAENAGIVAGDHIVEVDGVNIAGKGKTTDDIFKMLRGAKDTHVKVKVKRHNSPKLLSFDLVRGEVPVSPIDASYMIADNIGYVRLGKFSENTYTELLNTLVQQRADGAKTFIIDLRGNGGGYMNPAVLLANEFFDSGKLIVVTKGRNIADDSILSSDGSGTFAKEKVVVLVDEFTASASEIFAGAIQDNDRGLIIGRRTFGKGLVQRPIELPDSSEFRLTVQRYYTPSGRCIQKNFQRGHNGEYEAELLDRYDRGEIFSAKNVKMDSTLIFHTGTGRPVYGGGGIMPDVFVPSDTMGVTSYYIKAVNSGVLRKFAYEYADLNRERLTESRDTEEFLSMLPADGVLLQSFVNYAAAKGVPARWYYINISAPLIVNQIKALIARDIIGMDGYFEIVNSYDPVVQEALRQIQTGGANFPLRDK